MNIQNMQRFNMNVYLQVFERLHNIEPVEDYNNYEQDNEYYLYNMNVFIEHMRELASDLNNREQFDTIMIRIMNRSRGPSLLKHRVLREVLNMDEQSRSLPPTRMDIIGGKRRSKNKLRKSRKIKNNFFL